MGMALLTPRTSGTFLPGARLAATMRLRGSMLALVLVSVALLGCVDPGPSTTTTNPIEPCGELDQSFEPREDTNPRLRLETTNGTATVLVYGHQVPFTANHVRQLVQDGTWDETRFHYIIPDVGLFGGDPRSKSDDRQAWGSGGYHFNVVDEHHQFLRHDEAGVISLLSPQPNGAGSQFVITLAPQPDMDDRNPVFGRVIDGMETVEELARTPTDDRGRPQFGAYLDNATWVEPPQTEADLPELSAYGYDCIETAEPGDEAEFLVALRNTGQSILDGSLETSVDDEAGWDVSVRNAERIVVSSGQTVVYGLNVTVPESAETGTERDVEVTFSGEDEEVATSLELTTRVGELGEPAVDQEEVQIRYVGVLEDGRVFDTTEETYAEADSLTWFTDKPADPEPVTLEPNPQTLEASQPGKLVERAQLGETVVGFIAPEDAYGADAYGENGLGGRLLVFQVHIDEA